MTNADGNRQDMSVLDVEHPSLAATEEAQDVANIDRIVVPMPAYTDPSDPTAAQGSVNYPLDTHPVTHSADYGQDVAPGVHESAGVQNDPMAAGVEGLLDPGRQVAADNFEGLPADREEWTKANWQLAARHYGLAVSGNYDALKGRVEEHESTQELVAERSRELHGMNRDDLDKIAADMALNPNDYSRKEDLADAILAAESQG